MSGPYSDSGRGPSPSPGFRETQCLLAKCAPCVSTAEMNESVSAKADDYEDD